MLGTLQALGQMMLNVFVKFPVGILVWLFWFDSTNMTTIPNSSSKNDQTTSRIYQVAACSILRC